MAADPLAQVIDAVEIECGDAACDLHDLGRLPGEGRAAWLARLTERFAINPLPGVVGVHYERRSLPTDQCSGCGAQKTVGRACIVCASWETQ